MSEASRALRPNAGRPILLAAIILVAVDVLLLFVGPASSEQSRAPRARIGLVFDVGGRGDKSFNDLAYLGLKRAERELDVAVEYIEPTGSADREAALRIFAARGFDLVVGVGFIFSNDLLAVAKAYPRSSFVGIDFAPPPDGRLPRNLTGLKFREQEGAFLVGAAAALHSRSHRIGFVGGMDIPLIHKFEAGYRAGAREVCPTCEVAVAYAGVTPEAFKDPARGKELTLAQVNRGVDVVFHASGSTGLGVFEAARTARISAIGVDADQHDDMPGVVVTSMVKRVDVAVLESVRSVVEHRFRGGIVELGLSEGGIDWVHAGPHARHLSPTLIARVEGLRARIVARTLRVPATREELGR